MGTTKTPSLADSLAEFKAKTGRKPKIDVVLESLNATDRDLFISWLSDSRMSAETIVSALKAHAAKCGTEQCGTSTVKRWRADNGVT